MSLPRNKRRKITVDGVEYHWAVIYRDENTTTVLVHLAQKDPGQQLKVHFPGEYTLEPHGVAFLIRHCRNRQWNPTKRGPLVRSVLEIQRDAALQIAKRYFQVDQTRRRVEAMRKVKASFVEQVQKAMTEQVVSNADLARRLKVSRARITQALKPNTNITTKMMVRIADALRLEVQFTITPSP